MSWKKRKKLNEAIEKNEDFIAYKNSAAIAVTDIPLRALKDKPVSTPAAIWEGYDPQAEDLNVTFDGARYLFDVKSYGEEVMRVQARVCTPTYPSKRAIILVSEYGKPCQEEIATQLAKEGFVVCIPDYCGVETETLTSFPAAVNYGKVGQGGEHLVRVCPTPKDTCNYLYTLILRRTITFLEKEFSLSEPVLIGIRSGVEYAMQATGCDKRVRALGCICGAGYTELLSKPLYLAEELTLTPEKLDWMTGVSGASYLIHRDVPLFVGIGSNDLGSDIDRLPTLAGLVGKDNLRISVCNGYADNITEPCFNTLKKWLRLAFLDAKLPELPGVEIKTNADGTIYANIFADPCSPIQAASFYYAFDDYNHQTRNWYKSTCETVGKGEYLSNVPVWEDNKKMFFYAHVSYENGIELSGFLRVSDITDKRLAFSQQSSDNQLFEFGNGEKIFTEQNDEPVLFGENIVGFAIPVGLKGSLSKTGKMILFIGDVTGCIDKSSVLQVDCYSDDKNFDVTLCLTDDSGQNYYATKNVYTDVAFQDVRFSCFDFKDDRFYPLPSWKEAKKLTVCSKNVVIGKLLFV